MERKTVLFDLDGTLTESGTGITRAAARGLAALGIIETDQKKLDRFVGPPLMGSFEKFYGLTEDEAQEAVRVFRQYYETTGIFENRVYDGVEQMLRTLQSRGHRLIVATSKPEPFAIKVLDHFGLSRYFDLVSGATMDHSRVSKEAVIACALERAGLTDLSRVVMVGDREHDVLGARAHGIDTIGVLYGYGSREELTQAGAIALAKTPMDVPDLIEIS